MDDLQQVPRRVGRRPEITRNGVYRPGITSSEAMEEWCARWLVEGGRARLLNALRVRRHNDRTPRHNDRTPKDDDMVTLRYRVPRPHAEEVQQQMQRLLDTLFYVGPQMPVER